MNSVFLHFNEAGLLVLGLALFVLLSMASELGFRIGRWRGAHLGKIGKAASDPSTLIAGMLALLAFMLGLSIDFAQHRFEARRELVALEANTISTAWQRAVMIGGPDGEAMAGLIEDYAKTRLAFTRAEEKGPVKALIAKTGEEQVQIWRLATNVARRSPDSITATLINAVNDMSGAALSQRFAFDGRVPGDMVTLLVLGAIIAIGATGYQMGVVGARQPVLTSLLLLMWTGGIVITDDLNQPRLGNIAVDTSPLKWTIQEIDESRPLLIAPAPKPASPDATPSH